MEVRDKRGRKIGTVGPAYYPGTNCFVTILVILAIIGGVIFGGVHLIGLIANGIQANALPVHNSLRNIQIQGVNSTYLYSDNLGLHLKDTTYPYSNINYGDVDVSVTAKLMNYSTADNPGAVAGYGIAVRQGGNAGGWYNFLVTPNGKWVVGLDADTAVSDSAIKRGIGSSNILEVKTHGTHFVFTVNGKTVYDKDLSNAPSSGNIVFVAESLQGDPPATITVVFTDFTISRDN